MKDIPTSPRIIEIKRNRRIRRIRQIIIAFILFLFIFGGLVYLSGNKHILINNIEVNGTQIIDREDIIKEIQKNISGGYLYLFSKANIFIYPKNKIYNELIKKFPRIKKLSIERESLNKLNIKISERMGAYLYCGASIPEKKEDIGENCLFINNDGFIFGLAPYFSGNVYFKYYSALKEGVTNPLGEQLVSVERFHELSRFVDGVTLLGFKPIYLVIEGDGNHTLYLEKTASSIDHKILFKSENDLKTILDNLSLSMEKKEFADDIDSKYNTLEYIDLRFKNKVLYKFQ